jgi:hypothetical protein
MPTLTTQEIAQFRSILAPYNEALQALDAIEDCEGDLEDAALSLAIQVGQQPSSTDWLDGLAKRCRVALCKCQEQLNNNQLEEVFASLVKEEICPVILITPVMLYVIKQGVEGFCEPLKFKI